MIPRAFGAVLAITCLLPGAHGEQDVVERVRQLRAELLASSRDDDARISKAGYLEDHISQIEGLVKGRLAQSLNLGATSAQVLEQLSSMLQDGSKQPVNILRKRTPDAELVVVGYVILHGGSAMPEGTSVIEGFQNSSGVYRAVPRAGYQMSNCMMEIQEIASPRPGEIWVFARGRTLAQMQYTEKMRIYSFDGNQLRELWGTLPKGIFKIETSGFELRITYGEPTIDSIMMLTIGLTPAGPVELSRLPIQ